MLILKHQHILLFNPSIIQNSKFIFPSFPEQHAIASVLSSLDDKIELMREQNKILETTAQTIFKEWFVEFEFPIPLLRGTAAAGGWKNNQADYPPRQASPATPQEGNCALYPYWNLPKNQKLKERAKELRKQGILSEVVFWKKFKDKNRIIRNITGKISGDSISWYDQKPNEILI